MSLSVYDFVDEDEERDQLTKEYVRHSLAKDWNRWGDTATKSKAKEFKVILMRRKADNTTEQVSLTYKQFINRYKSVIKIRYPFLPLGQITELTRKLWLKIKNRGISGYSMAEKRSKTPKSSLKLATKVRHSSAKKVSFDLTENETLNDLVNKPFETKPKSKAKMSRFVKPLDINYESPEIGRQSRVSRSPDLSEGLNFSSPPKDSSPQKIDSTVAVNSQRCRLHDENEEKISENNDNNEMNDNFYQYVSPVINHSNSTKSLKDDKNIPLPSKKRVLKNRSNESVITSKKRLFTSPVKQNSKERRKASAPLNNRKIKASVPMADDGRPMGVRVKQSKASKEDGLCDLFDKDFSQTDNEYSLRSESLD